MKKWRDEKNLVTRKIHFFNFVRRIYVLKSLCYVWSVWFQVENFLFQASGTQVPIHTLFGTSFLYSLTNFRSRFNYKVGSTEYIWRGLFLHWTFIRKNVISTYKMDSLLIPFPKFLSFFHSLRELDFHSEYRPKIWGQRLRGETNPRDVNWNRNWEKKIRKKRKSLALKHLTTFWAESLHFLL